MCFTVVYDCFCKHRGLREIPPPEVAQPLWHTNLGGATGTAGVAEGGAKLKWFVGWGNGSMNICPGNVRNWVEFPTWSQRRGHSRTEGKRQSANPPLHIEIFTDLALPTAFKKILNKLWLNIIPTPALGGSQGFSYQCSRGKGLAFRNSPGALALEMLCWDSLWSHRTWQESIMTQRTLEVELWFHQSCLNDLWLEGSENQSSRWGKSQSQIGGEGWESFLVFST